MRRITSTAGYNAHRRRLISSRELRGGHPARRSGVIGLQHQSKFEPWGGIRRFRTSRDTA